MVVARALVIGKVETQQFLRENEASVHPFREEKGIVSCTLASCVWIGRGCPVMYARRLKVGHSPLQSISHWFITCFTFSDFQSGGPEGSSDNMYPDSLCTFEFSQAFSQPSR